MLQKPQVETWIDWCTFSQHHWLLYICTCEWLHARKWRGPSPTFKFVGLEPPCPPPPVLPPMSIFWMGFTKTAVKTFASWVTLWPLSHHWCWGDCEVVSMSLEPHLYPGDGVNIDRCRSVASCDLLITIFIHLACRSLNQYGRGRVSKTSALPLNLNCALYLQVLDINIKSAAMLAKEAHPHLKKKGWVGERVTASWVVFYLHVCQTISYSAWLDCLCIFNCRLWSIASKFDD